MNCSDEKNSREKECREEFLTCSDNVDEESNDVQGLPDIPGFDVSSLKDSGNGNTIYTDPKNCTVDCQIMPPAFCRTTTAQIQDLHARTSSMTVQKISPSKFQM